MKEHEGGDRKNKKKKSFPLYSEIKTWGHEDKHESWNRQLIHQSAEDESYFSGSRFAVFVTYDRKLKIIIEIENIENNQHIIANINNKCLLQP